MSRAGGKKRRKQPLQNTCRGTDGEGCGRRQGRRKVGGDGTDLKPVFLPKSLNLMNGYLLSGLSSQRREGNKALKPSGDFPQNTGTNQCLPCSFVLKKQTVGKGDGGIG